MSAAVRKSAGCSHLRFSARWLRPCRLPTRIGSFSSTRYGAGDKRSATAALPSSYCMASRTLATCSVRRPDCCSSISRRVAVGPSSSTSPMSPKMSASAMRTLMKNCSVSAGSLFLALVAAWRWDRDDHFPNGQRAARELLSALRRSTVGGARRCDAPTGWSVGVQKHR